jgi:hypothetical protein
MEVYQYYDYLPQITHLKLSLNYSQIFAVGSAHPTQILLSMIQPR